MPLTEDLAAIEAASEDMLDLDAALTELDEMHPRKARLLDLIAFLGYSTEDAAALLRISKRTADRDVRFTRAWLYARMRRECRTSTPPFYRPPPARSAGASTPFHASS